MRAGAEREAGLQVQHRAALRVVFLLPGGADEELFSHRDRFEILLPVIDPILLGATRRRNLVWDPRGFVALAQERDRLPRVFLRADVHMDPSGAAVLVPQRFVD